MITISNWTTPESKFWGPLMNRLNSPPSSSLPFVAPSCGTEFESCPRRTLCARDCRSTIAGDSRLIQRMVVLTGAQGAMARLAQQLRHRYFWPVVRWLHGHSRRPLRPKDPRVGGLYGTGIRGTGGSDCLTARRIRGFALITLDLVCKAAFEII